MARWRDIKQGRVSSTKYKKLASNKYLEPCASILSRIKAFITDMFMIMMPIMYITTYIILDGKDEFQSSEPARWITMIVFGIITILFLIKKGQTPGLKAYSLKLIDSNTKQLITFPKAFFRYILFLIASVSIVGALLPFFRKDKKTLQDLATNTCVIIDDLAT
jgi:uncharacterized RDD family membrane protein YckC